MRRPEEVGYNIIALNPLTPLTHRRVRPAQKLLEASTMSLSAIELYMQKNDRNVQVPRRLHFGSLHSLGRCLSVCLSA